MQNTAPRKVDVPQTYRLTGVDTIPRALWALGGVAAWALVHFLTSAAVVWQALLGLLAAWLLYRTAYGLAWRMRVEGGELGWRDGLFRWQTRPLAELAGVRLSVVQRRGLPIATYTIAGGGPPVRLAGAAVPSSADLITAIVRGAGLCREPARAVGRGTVTDWVRLPGHRPDDGCLAYLLETTAIKAGGPVRRALAGWLLTLVLAPVALWLAGLWNVLGAAAFGGMVVAIVVVKRLNKVWRR